MRPQEKIDVKSADALEEGHLDKITLAQQVGAFLVSGKGDQERSVVENLARVLANDVSIIVRQTLAEEVRACTILPRDVAERIAKDVEQVSAPFLEATQVFAERELVRLIPDLAEHARAAIARRKDVPETVSKALVQWGGDRSVSDLLNNDGARIAEEDYSVVVERFSERPDVMDLLAARPDLATTLVESIVGFVTDECRSRLIESYHISDDLAFMLAEEARIDAIYAVLEDANLDQVVAKVRELNENNELTPNKILALVERGDRRFFEAAMAELVDIPITNVRALMRNGGPVGLERLLSCAGFAESFVPLFETAIHNLADGRNIRT